MKNFKRIAALILAFVMVFALCACDNGSAKGKHKDKDKEEVKKTDAELIVGTWEAEIDLSAQIEQELESSPEMADLMSYFDFSDVMITMRLEFDKDGNYTMSYVDRGTKDAIRAAYIEGFTAMFNEQLAGTGYTIADVAAEENMSEEEYLNALADIGMQSVNSAFGEISSGKYEIEDGKLFMLVDDTEKSDDSYVTYKLSEDELTLKASYLDGEDEHVPFMPLTFDKA